MLCRARLWTAALVFAAVIPADGQIVMTSVHPASGPSAGGISITIRGSGFSDDACFPVCNQRKLTIGESEVPFLIVDSSTITAVTPPHAPGAVDVVYFPPDHPAGFEGYTLRDAFTYLGVAPIPTNSRRMLLALVLLLGSVGAALVGRR